MLSKWFDRKKRAIQLRKRGLSIKQIEDRLGIARSTLSGWFRDIKLTEEQKDKLIKRWQEGLVKARKKAVQWHNSEKNKRLIKAEQEAIQVVKNINPKNRNILDLALAMLYLGEGIKKSEETGMGNSDPLILKIFLYILRKNYNTDIKKIRCELHLRADQNPQKLKRFWAKELNLPIKNFKYVHLDERTIGIKTYPYYKGVCVLRCGNVAIQRKLLNISSEFYRKMVMRA